MSKPSIITIDGLAASGKSTVAARLAQALNYFYFDTGAMYRAVTWAVLDRDVDPDKNEAVSRLAESIEITVEPAGVDDGRQYTVRVDGQDVTWALRGSQVDAYVSQVACYPRVRTALTEQQRRIAAGGSIVMVGRDIGTVVLPDADLKIFLTASAEERARRRYDQTLEEKRTANYDDILAAIIERDRQDKANPVSPTKPAPDAVQVNTDGLSIEQVVERLKALALSHPEI